MAISSTTQERSGLTLYGTDTPIEELRERWEEIDKCEASFHKYRKIQRRLGILRDSIIIGGVSTAAAASEFSDKIPINDTDKERMFTIAGIGAIAVAGILEIARLGCRFTGDVNATEVRKLAKNYEQPVPLWAAESARQGELFDSWANANEEPRI